MFRRILGVLSALALVVALLAVADLLDPPRGLSGRVRVVDGDSLRIGADRVRLLGVDAPELAQTCRRGGEDYPCGRIARDRLAALIGGAVPDCRWRREDRWGRKLATCRLDGRDLAAELVAAGWAISESRYVAEESAARAAARGIWAGPFELPADWRKRNPRADGGAFELE